MKTRIRKHFNTHTLCPEYIVEQLRVPVATCRECLSR